MLAAYGFDRVILETVGVGQAELAIAGSADTAALVLVPESGDGVQVLKAGIMEIADLFVVNKADRPGAERLQQEVEVMLGLRRGQAFRHVGAHHGRSGGRADGRTDRAERPSARAPERLTERSSAPPPDAGWEPPVLLTVATEGRGVAEVVDAVARHHAAAEASGELERRRRVGLERLTRDVVERTLRELVWESGEADARLAAGLDDVVRGASSPYRLAQEIVASLTKGRDHGGA